MIKKKYIKKSMATLILAFILLIGSGCEKKAVKIIDDNTSGSGSGSSDITTESSSEISSNVESENNNGIEATTVEPYTWKEKIQGDGNNFIDFNINVKINGKPEENIHTYTVQTDDYNPEFIKNLCSQVFGDTTEVYDYKERTKKIVDADIELYNTILEMYESEEAGITISQYPGEEAPGEDAYQETLNVIKDKISELEAEKESAPEKVDNDYSYGGYIGQINGEEYCMILGNRSFAEYPGAPITYAFDGRVCCLYKKDQSDFFDEGMTYFVDRVPTGWKGKDSDVPENLVTIAQEFVDSIGFEDYKFSGAKSDGFYCQKGVDEGVFSSLDLPQSSYKVGMSGFSGYTAMFTMGGEKNRSLGIVENDIDTCADNCDMMSINSYILVAVNDNGVVGAILVNPMDVVDSQEVSIISDEDAKNIIVENINNIDAWNIPVENPAKSLELNQLKLVHFPVRSDKNDHEYTFVPAYIFTHIHQYGEAYLYDIASGYSGYNSPVMVINAVDGSFININKEIGANHFKGFERGNEGYNELFSDNWERYKIVQDNLNKHLEGE